MPLPRSPRQRSAMPSPLPPSRSLQPPRTRWRRQPDGSAGAQPADAGRGHRKATPAPKRQRRRQGRRAPTIETALGTRWAVWVGGLALALGGIFLVRYSIEAGIFGPELRLVLAAILGVALVAAGEFIRRTGFQMPVEGVANAYVPGILTAAGAFTLFGTIYAAHGIYGFIGPSTAFTLLGLIGIATIAASLVHGQALAGVGVVGSYVTPVLVSSEAPNQWALFGFIAIVLAAAAFIARLRDWKLLDGRRPVRRRGVDAALCQHGPPARSGGCGLHHGSDARRACLRLAGPPAGDHRRRPPVDCPRLLHRDHRRRFVCRSRDRPGQRARLRRGLHRGDGRRRALSRAGDRAAACRRCCGLDRVHPQRICRQLRLRPS